MQNKLLFFVILQILLFGSSTAQRIVPGPADTLWGASWQPWHAQIMTAPVLIQPVLRKNITVQEKICFDKKFFMKGTANGRVLDLYIYLNTTDGVVGIISGRVGTLGDGALQTDAERFQLLVISKKGNVYNYFNRKKKGVLEHYVTTGNSGTYLYNFDFNDGNDVIYKKTTRNIYCDNKFKTWLYKANGSDVPEFHLFGRNYPNKLVCKDFIGHSGVGYLNTDEGLYLICAMQKGANSYEMRAFEETDICFDPADFRKIEEEMQTKVTESLQKERDKLESKSFSGDCASQKTILNNFQKALNQKKKTNLEQTREGNVYQNRNTQKAYADLMDPLDQAQVSILDLEVKICQSEKKLAKATGSSAEKENIKLSCLNRQKSSLLSAKAQMEALDRTYATNPAKAFTEKNRILVQNMRGCN